MLLNHDLFNYAINLESEKKFSFDLLYNLSAIELKTLWKYLKQNLKKEMIHHSMLSAAFLILFTLKKNKKLCSVVNYCELNNITIKNHYSLSLITETLNQLQNTAIFIKLNVKDVYNQIRIKNENEWKTAFQTQFDLFKYLIVSFRLTNTSTSFQSYINCALSDCLDVFCIIYLNDILIYSKDKSHYVKHVCVVLIRLQEYRLFVKLFKCKFHLKKLKFLEFHIFIKNVFMKSDWVMIIVEWFKSHSVKNIQIFLEFANFYQQFIKRYFHIVNSLTLHLKTKLFISTENKLNKKKFNWNEWEVNMQSRVKKITFILSAEAKKVFQDLKNAFITALIMKHFNLDQSIRVEMNASDFIILDILV